METLQIQLAGADYNLQGGIVGAKGSHETLPSKHVLQSFVSVRFSQVRSLSVSEVMQQTIGTKLLQMVGKCLLQRGEKDRKRNSY